MKTFLILFCVIASFNFLISQNNNIDCQVILNQVNTSLASGDTTLAIRLYECINVESCAIKKGRHLFMSNIYYSQGNKNKAMSEIKTAIEKGLWGESHFNKEAFASVKKSIEEKYGSGFLSEIQTLHNEKLAEALLRHGYIINELNDIYEKDQELRRDKHYKECRNYGFKRRLSMEYDSTKNETEMTRCYKEFRERDSMVLQRFVDLINSIGHVPGDDVIFGTIPMPVLISHTAHFEFKTNLDNIYLKSIQLGAITPMEYAWYQGYREEYFLKESVLYFTNSAKIFETFDKDKIDQINRRRLSIGLPQCPAVLWNTRIH